MGHRKKSAPRRGSLAFLPRGRAASPIGRIRYWPEAKEGPVLCGFMGYKAGMTHVFYIEDKKGSPNFGKEVLIPSTVLDTPPINILAVRTYAQSPNGLRTLTEAWIEELPRDIERCIKPPKEANMKKDLEKLEATIEETDEVRVIAATQPRLTGVPKKKPDIMEIKIDGGSVKEQLEYAKGILGKTVPVSDVFKEGMYVDVVSVTKGKGFQGPVKRFGIKILPPKSRKTKRGVAAIGPWHPARVLYTVPRAGQMGYHRRIEYNKRILKIGTDGREITPKGGFIRYGIIRGMYTLIEGSVPGPTKRLVRLRLPARPPKLIPEGAPNILQISTRSHQG